MSFESVRTVTLIRIVLTFAALSVCAFTSASADRFLKEIDSRNFTKQQHKLSDQIVSLVYGKRKTKYIAAKYHALNTNINFDRRCLNSYIQPRILHSGLSRDRFRYSHGPGFIGGSLSFESQIGNDAGERCWAIDELFDPKRGRVDYLNRPLEAEATNFERASVNYPVVLHRVWVHVVDKTDVYIPQSLGSFQEYKQGYFAKSNKCSLNVSEADSELRNSIIIYRKMRRSSSQATQSISEVGKRESLYAKPEYEQLAINLAKDPDFVECYLRAHLVALGMEGGATIPRDFVMSQKLKQSGTFCDSAADVSHDRNIGLSCRLPARELAYIYSRMLVSFPSEERFVTRSEFKFEVLKTLLKIGDSSDE
jgi:hypothetical protein